eukprot:CAMPEP_0180341588 /NCGR_PEP_ID=MMETSP0989-20121125/1284_1 /TAXON_ID=697907 /ORGANISM="non described non described, Strain CCMP2293" /LENGTH=216 /DNA_ID=CAMNT_0022330391 /DNA_START=1429 /DNA_END=2075 /DNA_ORIENTATION=+
MTLKTEGFGAQVIVAWSTAGKGAEGNLCGQGILFRRHLGVRPLEADVRGDDARFEEERLVASVDRRVVLVAHALGPHRLLVRLVHHREGVRLRVHRLPLPRGHRRDRLDAGRGLQLLHHQTLARTHHRLGLVDQVHLLGLGLPWVHEVLPVGSVELCRIQADGMLEAAPVRLPQLGLLGERGAVVAAVALEGILLLPVADQAPLLVAQVEVHRAVR